MKIAIISYDPTAVTELLSSKETGRGEVFVDDGLIGGTAIFADLTVEEARSICERVPSASWIANDGSHDETAIITWDGKRIRAWESQIVNGDSFVSTSESNGTIFWSVS